MLSGRYRMENLGRNVPMLASAFRRIVLVCVIAALVVAAAGCGSSSKTSSTPSGKVTATTDKKVAAEVPAKYKSKGLTVAADASYAPNEYFAPDGKTVIGMDPDLANALGKVMGVKVAVKNAGFDGIIPGLAAKKYDIGMSSFTDTREREKTVDFVVYFEASTSFFVKAQGGPAINGLANLCGHKVAVEKGTTQQTDSTAQGKKCKASGKAGVTVLTYPDQNGANLALSSGRADVVMADTPPSVYAVKKSNGQFKLSGKPYGPFPYGIAIPKKSGLVKPVEDALKVLIKGGQYQAILKKWGLQTGAIPQPKLNAAIS
jgi:polar amino acid transport system substrate-binding protein